MKAIFAFAFLAIFCAVVSAAAVCDPDSNGIPDCSSVAAGTYRNFWDPTAYWVCSGSGAATAERCPDATLFLDTKGECVPWNEWTWSNPCGNA